MCAFVFWLSSINDNVMAAISFIGNIGNNVTDTVFNHFSRNLVSLRDISSKLIGFELHYNNLN